MINATHDAINEDRSPPENTATLDELFNEYCNYSTKVRGKSPETVKEQRLYFHRAATFYSAEDSSEFLNAICPQSLIKMVDDYRSTYSEGSCRWFQISLRSFLSFLALRGYTSSCLTNWVPAPRRLRLSSLPKAIPDGLIKSLLESIDPDVIPGKRDKAIITLLSVYGVRGFQIRHLKLCDIDWENELIRFPACKRGKPIEQSITPEAGNRLMDYLVTERFNESTHTEVFLTCKKPCGPFRQSASFSSIISRRLKQAKIELPAGVSHGMHGFRHAFATRLCGKVPLYMISDMLGHQDPSSVLIYSKVSFADLNEATLPWPEENRS